MSVEKILKNLITEYTPLDVIYNKVREEEYHKESYIERVLRHLSEDSPEKGITPVIKPVFNDKGHVIAYEPLKEKKQEHSFKLPRITH